MEMAAFEESNEFNDKLRGYFLEPATGTPEEFADIMRNDLARWSRVVKEAHLKID